jgi:anti-sigma B factor antagonist
MDITNEQVNGITVLKLSGRFDAYAAPSLEKFFQKGAPDTQPYIIINLEQVSFIDSTALAALITGMKRFRQQNGDLVICSLQQTVRVIFELTRLDKVFSNYATQEEAIKSVKQSLPREE